MGLDVWFREDVARALRAAQVAGREAQTGMESTAGGHRIEDRQIETGGEIAAYWRGYEAALATIGAAFGLALPRQLSVADDGDRHLGGKELSKVNGHSQLWGLGVRGEWE